MPKNQRRAALTYYETVARDRGDAQAAKSLAQIEAELAALEADPLVARVLRAIELRVAIRDAEDQAIHEQAMQSVLDEQYRYGSGT